MQLNKSLFSTVISLPVTSSLTLPSTKHLEKYKTTLTFPDPHLLLLLLPATAISFFSIIFY